MLRDIRWARAAPCRALHGRLAAPTDAMDFDFDFDADLGENFLTRKRGRVKAIWVVIPVAVFWLASVLISGIVGWRHQPYFVPYIVSLYGCAGFFVHAYMVGWRSGAVVFRYAALFIAVGFYSVLCFLHGDNAGARLIYSADGLTSRPPEPVLFIPVVLNVIAVIALLVHGFFLGLGSRAPTPTELGLVVVPANTSGKDDDSEDDSEDDSQP